MWSFIYIVPIFYKCKLAHTNPYCDCKAELVFYKTDTDVRINEETS